MHTRQNELNKWLTHFFNHKSYQLTPLAGDASFRRYYRVIANGISYVVMDAPPKHENIAAFIKIGKLLASAGVNTPEIYAVNDEHGFLLLEDLGDTQLLSSLTPENADHLYNKALTTLIKIQRCSISEAQLPHFDINHMQQELALFSDWFLQSYLNMPLNEHDKRLLDETFILLTREIAKQPQLFIHRDYHARNLMLIEQQDTQLDIGVIDFQDAMIGPYSYDLVSLLKDCYIQWPREHVNQWVNIFYQLIEMPAQSNEAVFLRDFEWCGLQRHLKVLGIFCRLYLRDKKPQYLLDLPLTFHYTMACLESYPEFKAFYQFMHNKVVPAFEEKRICLLQQ